MKNLETWILTAIIAILLIVGIAYYRILETVINPVAFVISLTIILVALILLIIFAVNGPKKKRVTKKQEPKPKEEKKEEPKAEQKKVVKKKSVAKKKSAKKKK